AASLHVVSVPAAAKPWCLPDAAPSAFAGALHERGPAHGLGVPDAWATGLAGQDRSGRIAGLRRGANAMLAGGEAGVVARLPPGGRAIPASARLCRGGPAGGEESRAGPADGPASLLSIGPGGPPGRQPGRLLEWAEKLPPGGGGQGAARAIVA